MPKFAVLVQYADGEEDFLCSGFSDRIATWPSKSRAQEQADFLNMGLDGGDRAIVVAAPYQRNERPDMSPDNTLSDGRPLDDLRPQDIAREVGKIFDRLAEWVAKDEPLDAAEREEWTVLLARAAAMMRGWATFGKWPEHEKEKRIAAENEVAALRAALTASQTNLDALDKDYGKLADESRRFEEQLADARSTLEARTRERDAAQCQMDDVLATIGERTRLLRLAWGVIGNANERRESREWADAAASWGEAYFKLAEPRPTPERAEPTPTPETNDGR